MVVGGTVGISVNLNCRASRALQSARSPSHVQKVSHSACALEALGETRRRKGARKAESLILPARFLFVFSLPAEI